VVQLAVRDWNARRVLLSDNGEVPADPSEARREIFNRRMRLAVLDTASLEAKHREKL
jgi:hypothetical protein